MISLYLVLTFLIILLIYLSIRWRGSDMINPFYSYVSLVPLYFLCTTLVESNWFVYVRVPWLVQIIMLVALIYAFILLLKESTLKILPKMLGVVIFLALLFYNSYSILQPFWNPRIGVGHELNTQNLIKAIRQTKFIEHRTDIW